MKNNTMTKFLLGTLLLGYTASAIIDYLYRANLNENERELFLHAVMVKNAGDKPSKESVLKSVSNEPWCTDDTLAELKHTFEELDELCCQIMALHFDGARKALLLLLDGYAHEIQEISSCFNEDFSIELLDMFARLHNQVIKTTKKDDVDVVYLDSNTNDNVEQNNETEI